MNSRAHNRQHETLHRKNIIADSHALANHCTAIRCAPWVPPVVTKHSIAKDAFAIGSWKCAQNSSGQRLQIERWHMRIWQDAQQFNLIETFDFLLESTLGFCVFCIVRASSTLYAKQAICGITVGLAP